MKPVFTRVGSMTGIFAFAAGVMAVACAAPPAGPLAGTDDADNEVKSNNGTTSSASPNNPASSNNGTPSNTPNNGGTTPTTPAPADPDSGTPTPTPTTPPADATCAAAPDMFACFDCCDAAHPGGWEVAAKAFDDCVCQTACAEACGSSYCAGNQPTAACEQCLQGATQCDDAANTACQGDANCTAADACAAGSQCDTKPEQ